tara:strand:+ start:485 stop:724 length:240 start_codon:yes stop_codon:yes gene_type:complete
MLWDIFNIKSRINLLKELIDLVKWSWLYILGAAPTFVLTIAVLIMSIMLIILNLYVITILYVITTFIGTLKRITNGKAK